MHTGPKPQPKPSHYLTTEIALLDGCIRCNKSGLLDQESREQGLVEYVSSSICRRYRFMNMILSDEEDCNCPVEEVSY